MCQFRLNQTPKQTDPEAQFDMRPWHTESDPTKQRNNPCNYAWDRVSHGEEGRIIPKGHSTLLCQ